MKHPKVNLSIRVSVCLLLLCSGFGDLPAQEDSLELRIQQLIDAAWDLALVGKDSSLLRSQQALEIARQYDYPFGEVLARESMGLYHEMVTGDIAEASRQYFSAIALCEAHQIDYLAELYHALGVMFHTTDNYENARRYYERSMEQATANGDSLLIKRCLINLGSIHSSLEDFVKAEQYMKESLDITVERSMDYATYGNLGYLYVKQEKFDQAIPILLRATEENPENPDPDLNLYFLLQAKTMAGDSSNMRPFLARARKAADSGQYGLRDQSLLYRNIADYLAFTERYEEALHYRDKYIEVYEEIREKQRDRVVLDMEKKYQTEKKDAQLRLLKLQKEKEAQQSRLYAYLALAGLTIAVLIGFFLYKNREKSRLLTQQKRQLEQNVEEINLLLREVHHRVKNNLQVITSLLNIQQRSISDEAALAAIQESKNRIESMGLIHRSFYQNNNLSKINSREYIRNLLHQLYESYHIDEQRVELDTKVDDIYLDMDTLVPLGLIINEMVSNTLKHAFRAQESGKLSISLEKREGSYQLEISDNGSGMNDLSALEGAESFGLRMIRAFVKKINGTLHLLDREGTTFQIKFTA